MTTPESFANYPAQLGELSGNEDASGWKPREALINVLRDIDGGKVKPSNMLIIFNYLDEEGEEKVATLNAGPSRITNLGLAAYYIRNN